MPPRWKAGDQFRHIHWNLRGVDANRRDLLGEHVNTRTFNVVAWVLVVALIVMTLFLTVATVFGLGR